MLPPIYYETCTDAVLAVYARLEDAILSAMVKRILRMGFVSEATKHQAEMLQEAGLLYEDILQLIAQRTDACTAQVRALFEDAGVTAVEIDNQAYRQAGIATVDIRQSDSLRQVLEAGFKKTMGVMDNLTKTTALTTQRAFYQACNDAYMQITSGAFSYQEAIRNTLKQAAKGGLSVAYPSGHVDKLDVAIRRAALTGVGQTAAEVSKTNAEDNGCYLMEITAHSGARPEHARWQGQLVSLTGKDVGKSLTALKSGRCLVLATGAAMVSGAGTAATTGIHTFRGCPRQTTPKRNWNSWMKSGLHGTARNTPNMKSARCSEPESETSGS